MKTKKNTTRGGWMLPFLLLYFLNWSLMAQSVSRPITISDTIRNVCPAITANLNQVLGSKPGTNQEIQWRRDGSPSPTVIIMPESVTAGTYRAYHRNTDTNQWSQASDPVVVTINNCTGLSVTSLPCNQTIPFTSNYFTGLESEGYTKQVGTGAVCLSYHSNASSLLISNTSTFGRLSHVAAVSVGIGPTPTCHAGFKVKGPGSGNIFHSGTFVGFLVKSSELLNIGGRSIVIKTLKNDAEVESKIVSSGADLLTLDLLGSPSSHTLGFVTTQSFDEFAIEVIAGSLEVAYGLDIYYPVIGNYCAGPSLKPNLLTPMNNNIASTYVVSERTGMHGTINAGSSMKSIDAIVSPSTTDSVDVSIVAGVNNRMTISVKDAKKSYPAGTFAGFTVKSSSLLGIELLNNTKLRFYRNGLKVDSVNNGGLLEVNSSLLGSSGKRLIGLKSKAEFDEVQLEVRNLAGLLTNLQIFNLSLQQYEPGTLDSCNNLTRLTNPGHPVMVNTTNTQIDGACVGCSITDVHNVLNESPHEHANITVTAGVAAKASLSVKNQIDSEVYPAGSFAGFEIENDTTLLNLAVLNSLKISTYKDGSFVEEKSGSTQLLSLDLLGTGVVAGRRTVGFVTTGDFDEIVIEHNGGLLALDLSSNLKVYNAVVQTFCTPPTLDCNVEYVLNSKDFPAIVNHERTGVSGAACVTNTVSNTSHLLDGDENTHATISVLAAVACEPSVSIQSINSLYPAGSTAGFIITNDVALAEADLLGALTITTYKNGAVRETASASSLLHLNVLGLLGGPTKARVFIKTTMDYDEVRLQVGSLASVLNIVHVYGTFVNTRGSNDINILSCCAADGHTPTLVSLEDVNSCPDDFASLTSNISNTCPVGTELQWYTSATLFNASTRVINPDTVTTSGTYYAVCYDSVFPCYSNVSEGIEIGISECCPVISINPATNVHPTSCGLNNGSITIEGLRINQTGYTLTYRKDGSTLVTMPDLPADSLGHIVISNLSAGVYTDIKVSHQECDSTNILSTTLTEQTKPAVPTNLQTNPTTVCANIEFTLSGTCTAGSTINWFTDLDLTTPVGTGPLTLTNSTPFYAACITGTCVSDPVRLDVVVTPIPTPPTFLTLSSPTICAGQSSVLSATCASGSVVWYNNIAMTTPINAEVSPPAGTHTYYARCENGTCKSTHEFIELTVNPSYPAPTLQATQLTIKSDETSTLSGSCTSGTLIWSNTEVMDAIFTDTIVSPDVTTTYYAACGPLPCAAVDSITITVEEDIFDLALRLQRAPGTPALVKHNDNVQVNVLVMNKGNINATDVGVVVYVPLHLTVADPNWDVIGQKAYLINKIPSIAGGDTTTVSINLTVDSTAINAIVVAAEISEAEGGVDINSTPDDDPTNDTFPNPPVAGGNLNGTKENDYDEVTLTVCQTGTCITAKYKRIK